MQEKAKCLMRAVLREVSDHIALHPDLVSHRLDPGLVHCTENFQPYHLLLRLNCHQTHALVAAVKTDIINNGANPKASEITRRQCNGKRGSTKIWTWKPVKVQAHGLLQQKAVVSGDSSG